VFVCIPPGKAVPKMTYTVSGGTSNPTHSLTVGAQFLHDLENSASVNHITLHYINTRS